MKTTTQELPHNIEAEQQLLGALLCNNDLVERISGIITSRSFFDPVHGDIFEHILGRTDTGSLATPVTLKEAFSQHKGLAELGGGEYLARLVASSISTYAIRDYAKIIDECSKRRDIVSIADDMRHLALDAGSGKAPSEQIEEAEQSLFALAEGESAQRGPVSFVSSMTEALGGIFEAFQRGGGLSGLPCGLHDFDRKMGGLSKSNLIIMAGRPSMGKTALATNIAFNIAKAYDKDAGTGGKVGFFSLEMSHSELTTRILADATSISSHKMRQGDLTEEDLRRLTDASKELEGLPLYIDDTPALPIAQLAARARRMKRTHGLDLLVVDYLQLMKGTSKGGSNRVQEIGEISMGLKAIAKDLDIPVIALSQLSRNLESRDDKRPMLSDLRESGSIEQDADIVTFVYRDEYYLERAGAPTDAARFDEWSDRLAAAEGKAEVIIGKHRHAAIGTIELSFEGEFTRFGNVG